MFGGEVVLELGKFQKDARTASRSGWDSGLSALGMESKGHRVEF